MKERAGSGRRRGEVFAPRGSQSLCGEKRFAFRQEGSQPGELEVAALGAQRAVPLDGARRQFRVDRLHLSKGRVSLDVSIAVEGHREGF